MISFVYLIRRMSIVVWSEVVVTMYRKTKDSNNSSQGSMGDIKSTVSDIWTADKG